jgi:hypothetical protein
VSAVQQTQLQLLQVWQQRTHPGLSRQRTDMAGGQAVELGQLNQLASTEHLSEYHIIDPAAAAAGVAAAYPSKPEQAAYRCGE